MCDIPLATLPMSTFFPPPPINPSVHPTPPQCANDTHPLVSLGASRPFPSIYTLLQGCLCTKR